MLPKSFIPTQKQQQRISKNKILKSWSLNNGLVDEPPRINVPKITHTTQNPNIKSKNPLGRNKISKFWSLKQCLQMNTRTNVLEINRPHSKKNKSRTSLGTNKIPNPKPWASLWNPNLSLISDPIHILPQTLYYACVFCLPKNLFQ
jgi:hypothetical protein